MEEYLDQAEILLWDVVQSCDISALVILHHLRDLASVLDNLKLYDECRLTGNFALDLAEALGRRSLEFRQEQAETLALIAGLTVYQPRARTLFIQAVAVCEEVVANNASHSNKLRLLLVLDRAGYWASGHLCAQWLERAVQLMTKELPPTMVHPALRSVIYYNYGSGLCDLKQYLDALQAYHETISISLTLVTSNPTKYNLRLAQTLTNMGDTLGDHGKYDDAIVVYKDALEICTNMASQDPLQYNGVMARTLYGYGITLTSLNRVPEAAEMEKRAISLLHNLAQTDTNTLSCALNNYASSCVSLGRLEEAVLAYQECILLRRALAAANPEVGNYLISALHNIAYCFFAVDRHAEANAAANEALERNHGRALEGCPVAPNFQLCFVCRRAMRTDSIGDGSSPLPSFLTNSAEVRAAHTAADTSTSFTSAHIPPTIAARRLGHGQPGVEYEAPVPIHLDPTAPVSFPPSGQPHFQGLTNSSTLTPTHTGRTEKSSVRRKRGKVIRLFRENGRQ